jgi:peptidoglycan hydrolase CwlO-like protein
MMNKKILAVLFLLLIVVSATVSYRVLNQPVAQNNQSNGLSGPITQDEMAGEINNIFINETQEIEIGEMV